MKKLTLKDFVQGGVEALAASLGIPYRVFTGGEETEGIKRLKELEAQEELRRLKYRAILAEHEYKKFKEMLDAESKRTTDETPGPNGVRPADETEEHPADEDPDLQV